MDLFICHIPNHKKPFIYWRLFFYYLVHLFIMIFLFQPQCSQAERYQRSHRDHHKLLRLNTECERFTRYATFLHLSLVKIISVLPRNHFSVFVDCSRPGEAEGCVLLNWLKPHGVLYCLMPGVRDSLMHPLLPRQPEPVKGLLSWLKRWWISHCYLIAYWIFFFNFLI